MAAMAANISKLLESQTITNENIKATQAQSSSQLDVISKQLAAQYEQTATLISTIAQNHGRTHQLQPPNNAPPMPHGLQIRPPKLNLPAFDGSNPLDWLFQADQYFSFYNITPPQRLSMIAFHLTGDALSWYKYLFNNRLLTTWEAFTRALETRFGPSTYDNHQAALFKLQQTSTVTAYQTEFERLSNCVVGLPPEALLNCFVSGLRQDIQQELAILRPHTITQAIGLAKLIEDKTNDQISPPQNSSLTAAPAPTSEALAIKRLSPAEMQQRRVDGLCFNCPEKYSPGHKCNPPKFLPHPKFLHPTNRTPTPP
ncbi:transposon ty3-G gag-pol polyprotein [Tanacetum coccineum]